jgi:hypothetical protein
LRAFGEVGDDEGQGGRGDERRTGALRRPRGQEPSLVLRDAPEQRRGREQHQVGDQDPAAAQDVTCPATQQQQAAEDQPVEVDDPQQAGGREPERRLDPRQRHGEHSGIQQHHQLRDGDD